MERLRFAQARVDKSYARAKTDWEAGALTPRLSREEAIGNKVDRSGGIRPTCGVRTVIQYDPTSAKGIRVLTSFPVNP